MTTAHLEPMRPRGPAEPGRTASTLELFFDLVFVVAVSGASSALHHSLVSGHVGPGLESYAVVFFGIWWAWMNFTWFATSFDTDDWLYRVLTVVQMSGVLVLAAGITPLFEDNSYVIVILGYVVMRIPMVLQWLRAARQSPELAPTARRYAAGIAFVQVLWLASLAVPAAWYGPVLVLLIAGEVLVPVLAERGGSTPRHPHHITERYGLFTLIVLGESLLASATAIIEAVHEHEDLPPLLGISALALVITAGMWWVYFWPTHHRSVRTFVCALRYGYVHYAVFAAAGAFSVGIELQIDRALGRSHLGPLATDLALAVPLAVFLLGIWWIAFRGHAPRAVEIAMPGAAVLVLLIALVPPVSLLGVAAVVIALVAVLVTHPPLPAQQDAVPDHLLAEDDAESA